MEKIALITGASRGIGAATALLAAKSGWAVAVNYHTHSAAAQAVVEQIRAGGGTAMAVQADVANEDDIVAMFRTVDGQLGGITALVNNAGAIKLTGVQHIELKRFDLMHQINTRAVLLCSLFTACSGTSSRTCRTWCSSSSRSSWWRSSSRR